MWDILKKLLGVLWDSSDFKKISSAFQTVQIKAVRTYIQIVDAVRKSAIGVLLMLVGLFLLAIGFVGIHVGLFLLLDLSIRTVGIVSLCLGGVYFLVPLIMLLKLTSEKTWMRNSKASEMVRKVAGSGK